MPGSGRRISVDEDYILPAAFSVYDIDPPSTTRRSTFPNSTKCFKCARFQALIKLYQVIVILLTRLDRTRWQTSCLDKVPFVILLKGKSSWPRFQFVHDTDDTIYRIGDTVGVTGKNHSPRPNYAMFGVCKS